MTTKVTITGSGMPLVQPHRAGPGVLVEVDDIALQFDADETGFQPFEALGLFTTSSNPCITFFFLSAAIAEPLRPRAAAPRPTVWRNERREECELTMGLLNR